MPGPSKYCSFMALVDVFTGTVSANETTDITFARSPFLTRDKDIIMFGKKDWPNVANALVIRMEHLAR